MGFIDRLRELAVSPIPALARYVYGSREIVSSVEIAGDSEFCEAIKEATLLLRKKDPPAFNLIDKYLKFVVQSRKSFLKPLTAGAMLALEKREVKNSHTWLACLLAWYGYCSKLYYESSCADKKSGKISWDLYAGDESWNFMYDCLKRIGGTYEETQHLTNFIKEEREKIQREKIG